MNQVEQPWLVKIESLEEMRTGLIYSITSEIRNTISELDLNTYSRNVDSDTSVELGSRGQNDRDRMLSDNPEKI